MIYYKKTNRFRECDSRINKGIHIFCCRSVSLTTGQLSMFQSGAKASVLPLKKMVKEEQPVKAAKSIYRTDAGKSIFVNDVQSAKAI